MANETIHVTEMQRGHVTMNIIGQSPLIMHRMAAKAARELLLPSGGRKTSAGRAATLKHDPHVELVDCLYKHAAGNPAPTRLKFPSEALKQAVAKAALDTPGTKKTEIGRLLSPGERNVSIFGIPQIFCSVVRSSDMNRTPDVRTRAILAEWCATVSFYFIQPKLTAKSVSTLLATAGITCGIGDWRQEKGSGDYGQFRLVSPDDADFLRIQAAGGVEAQDAAIAAPVAYDEDTEELLSWFDVELQRRRDAPVVVPVRKKAA